MGKGQRPPLPHVGVLFGHLAIGGGQLPVVAGPGAPVLKDHPRSIAPAGHLLLDVVHQREKVVVVAQHPAFAVPVLEILGAVDPQAVDAIVALAPLHLQEDGPHHRMPEVHFLAVHARSGKVVAVQQGQRLVVGVAVDDVKDHLDRLAGKVVQRRDQVDELVRPPAAQYGRVDGG